MIQLLEIIAVLLLALTLPGTLYLALLTLAGLLPARTPSCVPAQGKLAIIVPAHNEASQIGRTLSNLLAFAKRDGATEVIVIADNCEDDTAEIARHAGARVLERSDTHHRGKGYALDYAFNTLRAEGHVFYAVVDADSQVADNFIFSLRQHFAAGAQLVQTRYTVLNANASPRTQLASLALAAFNVLRPRGRDRLGFSAGILGNGFALRRDVLDHVPYTAASVVEDLEYHLQLLAAGLGVRFADDTEVRGEMPSGQQGCATQRARWEGGRLRMLIAHGPALAANILRGNMRMIEPLADLLLLPLAFHVLAIIASAMLGASSSVVLMGAGISLIIVALHIVVAVPVGGMSWKRLLVLGRVPGYLLWKTRMILPILSSARRDSAWVRTNRKGI